MIKPKLKLVESATIYQRARHDAATRAGLTCASVDLTQVQNKAAEARAMVELAIKADPKDREPLLIRARQTVHAVYEALDAVTAELGAAS